MFAAQIPIAELAARPTEAYLPRFRALALFGRRPPERVVRSSFPAAENLHTTGLMHRSKKLRSFDHLVGKREQRRRDFDAERLRGLEIDHQLEFARLYHGQVGGLFASQNA